MAQPILHAETPPWKPSGGSGESTHTIPLTQGYVALVDDEDYERVSWHRPSRMWVARIRVDNRLKHLGCFKNILDAVRARDRAALKYHGEFAHFNTRLSLIYVEPVIVIDFLEK